MAERRFGSQASTEPSTPAQAGHLGGRAGLIKEHQVMDFLAHARLAVRRPLMTRFTHVGALGFGPQKRFF
jgi:hypothetical protein